MKLAFFHHTLRLGSGIDTVIYELAKLLSKSEEVTVFCFRTDYDKNKCNFQLQEISSKFSNSTSKMMVLAPIFMDKTGQLKKMLSQFDIVNTHHYPANYIMRNIDGPLNLVTEWSAVTSSMFSTIKERLFIRWLRHANRVAAKSADEILAPCEFVKKWIAETYSLPSVKMFLDGVNFDIFDKSKVSENRILELHPQIGERKIILYVGRITESKNIHGLLEAFHIVKKTRQDVVLILAGDYTSYPPYHRKLLQIIKDRHLEQDVIFTGIVSWDDLPAYFKASTVYATCSLWEGFLRAEAFAMEKPMVCFNTGANSETVADGKNGFVVQSGHIEDFASKLVQIISDEGLAKRMGVDGYHWTRNNLDFDTITENLRSYCKQKLNEV